MKIQNHLKHLKLMTGVAVFNLLHTSAHAADGEMVLKNVFDKIEKTITGGGFRLATLAGGIGGIVVAGYKGNWPVAALCLGLAVTAHAFVDWVKASYTYLI